MNSYQLTVIGAGAAGLMSAISAARLGVKNILLLDAAPKPGMKILMSGGGRCNITNADMDFTRFQGESVHAIRKVLLQFPPEEVIRFFNDLGVKTKREEPWNKIFPVTDQAQTVLNALLFSIRQSGISFHFPEKVTGFHAEKGKWKISTNRTEYISSSIVLSTGGWSYPHTGSDGSLWREIKNLGIEMAEPAAALTPLKLSGNDWSILSGITISAQIVVRVAGKEVFRRTDSLLFTHQGISGPLALDASEYFTRFSRNSEFFLCLWPDFTEELAISRLKETAISHPDTLVENWLKKQFPERLIQFLFSTNDIPSCRFNQLTKEGRRKLAEILSGFRLPVSGHSGFKKAEVTAGGIRFSEINLKTMELKRYPGLFASGEVVNVHGPIGGYNFQWAWSSGFVAGKGVSALLQ